MKTYEVMCTEIRTSVKYIKVEAEDEVKAKDLAIRCVSFMEPDDYYLEKRFVVYESGSDEDAWH